MVAYTYSMPSGIPGTISRGPDNSTVEAQMLDTTYTFTAFGLPAKMVSGKLRPIASGDTNADVVGFLARPYPTSGNGTDGLGVGTPNTQFPADLMVRGYMNVVVNGDVAPAKNGTIYVRKANGTADKPIGGIEAAADGSDTFALDKDFTHFTGTWDSNQNAEIAYNI